MICSPNNYMYVPNKLFLNKGGKIYDASISQYVNIYKLCCSVDKRHFTGNMCVTFTAEMKYTERWCEVHSMKGLEPPW